MPSRIHGASSANVIRQAVAMVGRDGAIEFLLLTEDVMQCLFSRSRLLNNLGNSTGEILCLESGMPSV
jgi:hypothetical protein